MNVAERVGRVLAGICIVGGLACSDAGLDAKKFDAVQIAAQSVRADAHTNNSSGSARFGELLETLKSETAVAERLVDGRPEKAALRSYADAAEAYRYFLRFRDLDPGAAGDMILLRGSNRPVAIRYGIPREERGGGRWVNRKTAMAAFSTKADEALAEAARIVGSHRAR